MFWSNFITTTIPSRAENKSTDRRRGSPNMSALLLANLLSVSVSGLLIGVAIKALWTFRVLHRVEKRLFHHKWGEGSPESRETPEFRKQLERFNRDQLKWQRREDLSKRYPPLRIIFAPLTEVDFFVELIGTRAAL